MTVPRREGYCSAREARYIRGSSARAVRAVAQLAVEVIAPAFDAPRSRQRAGVLRTGGDGDDAARKARDTHRRGTIGRCNAQLAESVLSPAFHTARRRERAAVERAKRHGDHAAGKTGDGYRNGTVRGRRVAQLAFVVASPASHAAIGAERATVIAVRPRLRGGGLRDGMGCRNEDRNGKDREEPENTIHARSVLMIGDSCRCESHSCFRLSFVASRSRRPPSTSEGAASCRTSRKGNSGQRIGISCAQVLPWFPNRSDRLQPLSTWEPDPFVTAGLPGDLYAYGRFRIAPWKHPEEANFRHDVTNAIGQDARAVQLRTRHRAPAATGAVPRWPRYWTSGAMAGEGAMELPMRCEAFFRFSSDVAKLTRK